MPDNPLQNQDDLSLDELIAETKEQINAPPGEIGSQVDGEDSSAPAPEGPSPENAGPAPQPDEHDFMPDFGDAFDDYGQYEMPQPESPPESYGEGSGYEEENGSQYDEYAEEYDEDYDENYEPEDGDDAPPPKKPKRKTGKRIVPLFVKIIAYVVIVGVIAVGLGYGAWECARDVLAFGRSSEELTVVVRPGDTVDDIGQMLKDKGVIKYPWLFKFYCDFTKSGDSIDPGRYVICYNYDYHALVNGMIADSPERVTIRVTIPEGYTCAQIFSLMEENKICSARELRACAASKEFDYWFLEGVPYGGDNRLEGFLFPDTYDFYENDNPERVLNKLLSNFQKKFSEDARTRLDGLNELLARRLRDAGFDEAYIRSHAFGVYELMTVASMIEKETAAYEESTNISSVIYNRLCDPVNYPLLNIDATVIYALGGNVDHALTYEDTQIQSPYNTYVVQGLPAGPISNPGLDSISAALNPAQTDYFYYALDKETGFHHFSATYEEHQQFLGGQADEE